MTNAIMKPDANPFANYQSDRQKHFPGRRMKFNKGEYLVGKDGDTLPIGTQLVAVMSLLTLGYQYWVGNDLVDTRLGLYVNGFVKPPRPTLGDTDREAWPIGLNGRPKDPWTYIKALPFVDPRDHEVYTFITETDGGIGAIDKLAEAYRDKGVGLDKYPLIKLGVDWYMHRDRTIGKVKTPLFIPIIKLTDAAPYDAVLKAASRAAPSTAPEMPEEAPAPRRPIVVTSGLAQLSAPDSMPPAVPLENPDDEYAGYEPDFDPL